MSLPCFQIGNCTLPNYKNDANEDLGLIVGNKTVKLGFNENDKCFDKTSGETILYTSNLTYNCSQESSSGIVTNVRYIFNFLYLLVKSIVEFKDLTISCTYKITPTNVSISQTIESSAKQFSYGFKAL